MAEPPSCDALKPRPNSFSCMVLPDLHVPAFDPGALGAVLLAHEALKPKETVILGDWLDCETWSSHPPKSLAEDRAKSFHKSEIQPVNRILDRFELNSERTIYLAGNHEDRVERKLVELGSLGKSISDLCSPKTLLAEDRSQKLRYIDYTREPTAPMPHYKIAEDLIAVHGWSFARHAAAKHLEIAKSWSVLFGHCHRQQAHVSRDPISGRVLRASSPGCLSLLQPLYLQHNPSEWSHGFELVWVSNDKKSWTSYTVMIRDGVCVLPGGLKIDGNSRQAKKLVQFIKDGKN